MKLKQYKLAWGDFEKWYDHLWGDEIGWGLTLGTLLDLPFEMQLGVYLKYLDEVDLAIDGDQFEFTWITSSILEIPIEQAFKIRNEQLKK